MKPSDSVPPTKEALILQAASWHDLLSVINKPDQEYTDSDLRDLFEHQLHQSIQSECKQLEHPLIVNDSIPASLTFSALFAAQEPSIEALVLVKEFAKHLPPSYPKPIATAFYYMAILCALQHEKHITSLDESQLRAGVSWLKTRTWLPPSSTEWISTLSSASQLSP